MENEILDRALELARKQPVCKSVNRLCVHRVTGTIGMSGMFRAYVPFGTQGNGGGLTSVGDQFHVSSAGL